jgi:nucleoside-diphosphate-sugar epimerase
MTKRWIITGGNGYLGGELCQSLNRKGFVVIALARAGRSLGNLDHGIACHTYDELPGILSKGDIFVHCAGKVGITGPWDEFVRTNIEWSATLFDQAASQRADCFVYISSVAALGYKNRPGSELLDESSLPHLAKGELYGRSKWLAEQTLEERANNSSTRLIILRPGLIYGRRPFVSSQTWLRRGIVVDPGQRVPLVHIDNFVDAVGKVALSPEIQGVFFVVDDDQPTLHDMNTLKKQLGILQYHPWCIGKMGFWPFLIAQEIVRQVRGRGDSLQDGYARAQYYFQTRRLRYSTQKLRNSTGWIPKVNLIDGLNGCHRYL